MFSDFKLHALQAKAYSALGKRLQQHRALAESYFLQGQLGAAVERLQFAQQATDGNFYSCRWLMPVCANCANCRKRRGQAQAWRLK